VRTPLALRAIRLYGDPVLREKALRIETVDDDVRALAADMLETLLDAEGVGLAGPQVGERRRIIVVHPPPDGGDSGTREPPRVFLNPRVVSRSGPQESAEEGCLSIPGVYEVVKRPHAVRVEAMDLDGARIELDVEGLPARIIQHEIDHLDGILFVDRIGPMRRALLKKQLRAFLEE
jgi:peptide deformylase